MAANVTDVQSFARAYEKHIADLMFSLFGINAKGSKIGLSMNSDDMMTEDKNWMLEYFSNAGKHSVQPPSTCFDPHESGESGSGPFVTFGLMFEPTDDDCVYFRTINPVLQVLWIDDLIDFLQRKTNSVVARCAAYDEDECPLSDEMFCWGFDLADEHISNVIDYKKFERFVCDDNCTLDTLILQGGNPFADTRFSALREKDRCDALEWVYLRNNCNVNIFVQLAKAYEDVGMKGTAELVVLCAYVSSTLGGEEKLQLLEELFPTITARYSEEHGRPRTNSISDIYKMFGYQ